MHDLTIFAGLQAFRQTVTAAIAVTFQLQAAAAAGLDPAVADGQGLDLPGAGWAGTLLGGADLGTPGWPE